MRIVAILVYFGDSTLELERVGPPLRREGARTTLATPGAGPGGGVDAERIVGRPSEDTKGPFDKHTRAPGLFALRRGENGRGVVGTMSLVRRLGVVPSARGSAGQHLIPSNRHPPNRGVRPSPSTS